MGKNEKRRHSSISRKILLGLGVVWIVTVLIVCLNISALKIINEYNSNLASQIKQIKQVEQSNSTDSTGVSEACEEIEHHASFRISGTIVFNYVLLFAVTFFLCGSIVYYDKNNCKSCKECKGAVRVTFTDYQRWSRRAWQKN